MKGREGELLLLLLFEPMQSGGGTSNPQRVGNPFGWGRFPFDRDLPFFIVLFGLLRFIFRESRPVRVLYIHGTLFNIL